MTSQLQANNLIQLQRPQVFLQFALTNPLKRRTNRQRLQRLRLSRQLSKREKKRKQS